MNAKLTEAQKVYETENDISRKRRSELNALMNQRLADALDLQMQMKAHRNVKGPSFIGLHELFDKVHEVVERKVQLGGHRRRHGRIRACCPGQRQGVVRIGDRDQEHEDWRYERAKP